MDQALVANEIARTNTAPPINSLALSIIGPTVIALGTVSPKQRYREKILTPKELWWPLHSEPIAGSDLASFRTRTTQFSTVEA